ncbi:MAG: hypothetical protein A2W26_13230 [Acidobacteria bacterium RBG_16_64_8]|nr:MAG: hypothetical protein A2W26_13230 [Acidobacteria bacterium RBG_16_64_8]
MKPPVESPMCRTCKKVEPEDGQVRCRGCHAKFREWLDGGAHLVPVWNGVIADPTDEYQDSSLHRALAQQGARMRNTFNV